MYSVSQAKYNALKKENERLKEDLAGCDSELENALGELKVYRNLLSEDLVAENAKLKLKIWEMECAIPKVKADAIREAISSVGSHWSSDMGEEVIRTDMLERHVEKLEQGK